MRRARDRYAQVWGTVRFLKVNRDAVDLVVIHTAECPRKPGMARNVADWLDRTNKASAHYIVDSGEVVQCVPEEHVAWHAPGANRLGIGIEIVGRAKDSWCDDESQRTLERVIDLTVGICRRWNIPAVWLGAKDLAAQRRGITGHNEVTDAYNGGRGHWDPGEQFPRAWFTEQVAAALGATGAPVPSSSRVTERAVT